MADDVTTYLFECPNGHRWVQQDTADPESYDNHCPECNELGRLIRMEKAL